MESRAFSTVQEGSWLPPHQTECICMSIGKNYFVLLSVMYNLQSCQVAQSLGVTPLVVRTEAGETSHLVSFNAFASVEYMSWLTVLWAERSHGQVQQQWDGEVLSQGERSSLLANDSSIYRSLCLFYKFLIRFIIKSAKDKEDLWITVAILHQAQHPVNVSILCLFHSITKTLSHTQVEAYMRRFAEMWIFSNMQLKGTTSLYSGLHPHVQTSTQIGWEKLYS